jgi:Zn-dependent oligopeptidase
VRSLLEALRATVARLQDDPAAPTWDNFVEPMKTTASASAAPGASPPTCTA